MGKRKNNKKSQQTIFAGNSHDEIKNLKLQAFPESWKIQSRKRNGVLNASSPKCSKKTASSAMLPAPRRINKVHYSSAFYDKKIDKFTRKSYRDCVAECLEYCIKNKSMVLYGYVIMNNDMKLSHHP